MKIKSELIANEELKDGFIYNAETKMFNCLFCSVCFEDGDIYSVDNRLVCAEKAVKLHISAKHGFVFENLLLMDKAQTGLTDTQKDFLRNYYAGLSDKEIAEKMNISASTVRFQRHNFREKVKQAKVILALDGLLAEKGDTLESLEASESGTKLKNLFSSVSPLVLKTFLVKEKNKIFILETIVKCFEKGKKYTEKEINDVLLGIYDVLLGIYNDYASIRRGLRLYTMKVG